MTKQNKKTMRYAKWGYFFSVPFCLFYLAFSMYPLIYTLVLSFSDVSGFFSSSNMQFVGIKNYLWILKSKKFLQSVANTLAIFGISYLFQLSLGLVLAACLCNRRMRIRGQGFLKYIVYMPNIIMTAAIGMLFSNLFSFPGGFMNILFRHLGILEKDFKWLGNQEIKRGLIIYLETWRLWGYGMLVNMAAIMSINPELYEVAEIDGANGVHSFLYITLPCIRNVELFLIVAGITGGLQMYDIPMMLGTTTKTNTIMMFIMDQAFTGDYRYNTAAAASFIIFLFILLINIVVIKLLQNKDERWLSS